MYTEWTADTIDFIDDAAIHFTLSTWTHVEGNKNSKTEKLED